MVLGVGDHAVEIEEDGAWGHESAHESEDRDDNAGDPSLSGVAARTVKSLTSSTVRPYVACSEAAPTEVAAVDPLTRAARDRAAGRVPFRTARPETSNPDESTHWENAPWRDP